MLKSGISVEAERQTGGQPTQEGWSEGGGKMGSATLSLAGSSHRFQGRGRVFNLILTNGPEIC